MKPSLNRNARRIVAAAAAGLALSPLASLRALASPAPVVKAATQAASSPEELKRYVVIVARINTEVRQPSLLELPTAGVVTLFKVAVSGIGWAAADSYSAEADNWFVQRMSVAESPGNYTIVRAHVIEESHSGAGSRGWSGISTEKAEFRWHLRRKGFFEGSSWFGGAAVAVALRNGEALNAAEADAILKAAVDDVQRQLAAAAQARNAEAKRREEELHRNELRNRPVGRRDVV